MSITFVDIVLPVSSSWCHLPRIQDFWNRKGLLTTKGDKKKAFFVLQAYYRELAAREAGSAPSETR